MTNHLFSNVVKNDPLSFFSNHGLKSPREVAQFLDLNEKDVSKMAGVAKASIRWDDRIPRIVLQRMEEIANVCSLVAIYFDGDPARTALWFHAPNPMLGNITPRDMLRFGRYAKLVEFVTEALQANEASVG